MPVSFVFFLNDFFLQNSPPCQVRLVVNPPESTIKSTRKTAKCAPFENVRLVPVDTHAQGQFLADRRSVLYFNVGVFFEGFRVDLSQYGAQSVPGTDLECAREPLTLRTRVHDVHRLLPLDRLPYLFEQVSADRCRARSVLTRSHIRMNRNYRLVELNGSQRTRQRRYGRVHQTRVKRTGYGQSRYAMYPEFFCVSRNKIKSLQRIRNT